MSAELDLRRTPSFGIAAAMTGRQLRAELDRLVAEAAELDERIASGKSGRRLRPLVARRIERLRAILASR